MDLFGSGFLSRSNLESCINQASSLSPEQALNTLLGILDKLPTTALGPADWQSLLVVGLSILSTDGRANIAHEQESSNGNSYSQLNRIGRELRTNQFGFSHFSQSSDEERTI